MIIIDKRNKIELGDVQVGDCLMFNNELYIKCEPDTKMIECLIQSRYSAIEIGALSFLVNLNTGELKSLSNKLDVHICKAKVEVTE